MYLSLCLPIFLIFFFQNSFFYFPLLYFESFFFKLLDQAFKVEFKKVIPMIVELPLIAYISILRRELLNFISICQVSFKFVLSWNFSWLTTNSKMYKTFMRTLPSYKCYRLNTALIQMLSLEHSLNTNVIAWTLP